MKDTKAIRTMLAVIWYGREELNEKVEFGFNGYGFYLIDHAKNNNNPIKIPFRNPETLALLKQYRRTHSNIYGTAKEIFPDWNTIEPENWGTTPLDFGENTNPELDRTNLNIYREPTTENYSYLPDETTEKDITLNIIAGDNHIFCHSIYMGKTKIKGDQHV